MKKNLGVGIVVVSLLIVCSISVTYTGGKAIDKGALELRVIPSKSSYTLGELNTFAFELVNNTEKDISILNTLRGSAGYLQVLVSKDGSEFKEYYGVRWGKDDLASNILSIKPGESITNTEFIFWNSKPITSKFINPDVVKRATDGKIMSYYAFPDEGIYKVKASYRLFLPDSKDPISIESAPVQVSIELPSGEDLEVWNRIKNNGEIAYLIQEGSIRIPSYKSEERAKFQSEVEGILVQYPNSFYATSLQQSLNKFKVNEAKRQERLSKQEDH